MQSKKKKNRKKTIEIECNTKKGIQSAFTNLDWFKCQIKNGGRKKFGTHLLHMRRHLAALLAAMQHNYFLIFCCCFMLLYGNIFVLLWRSVHLCVAFRFVDLRPYFLRIGLSFYDHKKPNGNNLQWQARRRKNKRNKTSRK